MCQPADAPAAAAASAAAAQVIIFAAAGVDVPGRANLIEAWCSEDSPLGKTGDDLKPARIVFRFIVKEDLNREQTILDALEGGKAQGHPPPRKSALHAMIIVATPQSEEGRPERASEGCP